MTLRSVYVAYMDTFVVFLFLGLSVGHTVDIPIKSRCPTDYRRRVETCIMEAQLAPQAGGGITLVLNKDTMVNLCDRGMLRKTIDCLAEIHTRCVLNTSVVQELDRLYSVPSWQEGAQLLCEDTQLFQENFECLSRAATSVTACILMRTHTFRMGLAFTDPSDHATVKDVTCSFAESIVKCLCSPLEDYCPRDLMRRVSEGMRLLLPPLCVADPGGDSGARDGARDVTPEVKNVTVTTETVTTVPDVNTADAVDAEADPDSVSEATVESEPEVEQ